MRTLLVLLIWAAGCEPVAPDLSATTAFDQPGPAWAHKEPPALADPGPPPPPESGVCADILKMLPQLEERMRSENPPAGVLDALERCFHSMGRGPEIVGLYRRMHDASPKDAARTARLAGAFVTLGDGDEALRVLADAPPDDPAALFLRGLVLASEAPKSDVAKRGARDAWRRLLEVAPDHRGLDSVSPSQIRGRVLRWSEELGERGPASPPTTGLPATAAGGASPPAPPKPRQSPASQPAAPASPAPRPEAEETSPAAAYAKAMFQGARAQALGRGADAHAAYTRALELRPNDPQALEGLQSVDDAD